MNKRILISLNVIGVAAAVAVGGTVAYFSDTETSARNTFTAGTLDLSVGGENPNKSPDFTIGGLYPGQSGTITYTLSNVGSIAGFLDLSGITVVDTEGANPESETGDRKKPGELSSNIHVTVRLGGAQPYAGLLKDFGPAYDADVPLAGGASTTLTIDWVVDKDNIAPLGADVGNDVQGDIVTVSFTIELDQVAD